MEPTDSLGHLQIKDLPELTTYPHLSNSNSKYFNPRSQNTSGYMWGTNANGLTNQGHNQTLKKYAGDMTMKLNKHGSNINILL